MLTNTILFVPGILIHDRFRGALSAMLLSLPIGYLLAHFFTKVMSRFPGQGLPEIFKSVLPKWIRIPYTVFLAAMWFATGSMVLVTYSRILQRFVSPDFNLFVLIAFIGIVCAWTSSNNSKTVLYITEIVLLLNLPFLAIILFKAISGHMNWDAIKLMRHYVLAPPSWPALAAATYLFTGYINWSIFNRDFTINMKKQRLWLIPIVGLLTLSTSFFIPIGYHGTLGVENFIYIWVSTADSMRLEFGFIERVLYIFLLLYFSITMLFISITWHVGSELFKSVLTRNLDPLMQRYPQRSLLIISLIPFVMAEATARIFNEKQYLILASTWFQLRLPVEIMLVITVCYLGRRRTS
ncbi:Spore germination protein [compost metagenome]